MHEIITPFFSVIFLIAAGLPACGGGNGEANDQDAAIDGGVADGEVDGGEDPDAFVEPRPSIEMEFFREAAGEILLPDVRVVATIFDAENEPWDGDVSQVSIVAENPQGIFDPDTSGVEVLGEGRYSVVVSSPQSGEVRIEASAVVEGETATAEVTVVFLTMLSPEWSIPRSLDEINTDGQEDSIAVSPDGNTLFFSYSPLVGCPALPTDEWTSECMEAAGPYQEPERPCVYGVDENGFVTEGLYGNSEEPPGGWPFTKGVYNSYAAHRDSEGRFSKLDCLGFEDDGVIMEVSPTSGPENPVVGESYTLFFAYPDWLDFFGDGYHGTVFTYVAVTAGEHANFGGPVTSWGIMPPNMKAAMLTGPINDDLQMENRGIGEYRVYLDPEDSNHYIYLPATDTTDASNWLVKTSELLGDYPQGDWGNMVALPLPINTPDQNEIFPWPVTIERDGVLVKELFFNRGPQEAFSAPTQVLYSRWENETWMEPVTVMETDHSFGLGTVFILALPAVADRGDHVEMFFVYSILTQLSPEIRWNHQIAVSRTLK